MVGGFAGDGLRAVGRVMVVEGCEVFLELKGRVELLRWPRVRLVSQRPLYSFRMRKGEKTEYVPHVLHVKPTSFRGTKGGPAAMSAAFVPGCTLRLEFASSVSWSTWFVARLAAAPPEGDLGPCCISAGGGGLGSRGELGAKAAICAKRNREEKGGGGRIKKGVAARAL